MMKSFTRFTGIVAPFDIANVDTILNQEPYRNAPILLTHNNFGCGTSKEHAPWAIAENGIRVIIAASFADTFYEGCFKNGILPIQLPEKDIEFLFDNCTRHSGYQLSIDLENQKVEDSLGYVAEFDVTPNRKNLLLNRFEKIGSAL